MQTQEVLRLGTELLKRMEGKVLDVLTVTKPKSLDAAVNLSKVISKLSPLVGNMIEFNSVAFLNDQTDFQDHGTWLRQDPGFPDTIFHGVTPTPGFEIKAWFPLATEMTARFKDSQNHFAHDQTSVAILAWLPEHLIFGKPRIVGVCVVSGLSVAKARDNHYHNPPDYLVMEPEDTTKRTRNLQQTNTSGHKFQGSADEFTNARHLVQQNWGADGMLYDPAPEYQKRLFELTSQYKYRLDTNFAKMDRIVHAEIEEFKRAIYGLELHGKTVREWNRLLGGQTRGEEVRSVLQEYLGIQPE